MIKILLFLLFLVGPDFAFAANLVPCGGPNEQACQACNVVGLVNGVITWLIGILGTIAAIMIVYAGIKLVTSGGNVSAKSSALEIFNHVIIGFVIVMAGWLLIDTIMKAMLNDSSFGVWNQIKCVKQPEVKRVNLIIGSVSNTCDLVPGDTLLFNCSAQENTCTQGNGVPVVDRSSNPWTVTCTYSGGDRPPDLSAGGACEASLIEPYFGSQTGNAQCIIQHESVCGASNVSTSDVMSDGRAFSFGPMQINLTVHELRNCSGHGFLDCKSAFSGRNYTAHVIDENLYQECARAAQDTDCNIRNGRDIFNTSGWGAWSTARACGL